MLKSIWLEGKRNWHMDHLIHMLVDKFMLEINHCHKQQTLWMEGPNLGEKHCREILTCAPKTLIEKIKKIDDFCFEVESSNSESTYEINLDPTACSCSNFPHILAMARATRGLIQKERQSYIIHCKITKSTLSFMGNSSVLRMAQEGLAAHPTIYAA